MRDDEVTPADIRQTVGELLRILFLRRWVFVVPFCLATTAAFMASQYIPRMYRAETIFEQTNDPVSVNLPPALATSEYSYFLSTLEQDIKSDEVTLPILDELGLIRALPRDANGAVTEEGVAQREGLAKVLASRIEVTAWRKSAFRNVIQLRYTGPEAGIMTKLLNGMKEGYKQLVRRRVTEKLRDARDWYAAQAEEKQTILDDIDARVTAVRMQHPGVDPANPESIALELNSLEASLADLRRANSRLESQIASRKEFLANAKAKAGAVPEPDSSPGPPTVAGAASKWLRQALEESEARVAEFKIRRGMTDLHPDIVEEHKLQQRYREALAAETRGPPEQPAGAEQQDTPYLAAGAGQNPWLPAVAQVEMDLASLIEQHELGAEEIARLEEQTAEYVAMQGDILAKRQEFGRLEEELQRAREEYETYRGLVDQCNRALTVENQNRGILFTDVVPVDGRQVAVSPLAKTVLLLSFLAGAITGTVFVIVAELFDRRFRTSVQVSRALGLPILENINEIVTPAQRRKSFIRRSILVPAAAAVLLAMVLVSGAGSYLSLNHPDSYQRLMRVPRSVWAQVAGASAAAVVGPGAHQG